jgi:hypothetical protein
MIFDSNVPCKMVKPRVCIGHGSGRPVSIAFLKSMVESMSPLANANPDTTKKLRLAAGTVPGSQA